MIFQFVHEDIGTLNIHPARKKIDAEGHPYRLPGLEVKLTPAWGSLQDGWGPRLIDTDNMLPGNVTACEEYWEMPWSECKEKLEAWLSGPDGKKRGASLGDPRPNHVVTVKMTEAELTEFNKSVRKDKPSIGPGAPKFDTAAPPRDFATAEAGIQNTGEAPFRMEPNMAQSVVTGARTAPKGR